MQIIYKTKTMKKISVVALMLCLSQVSFAQNKDADSVRSVLKQYNTAVGKLDVTGTEKLSNGSAYFTGVNNTDIFLPS